MPVTFSFSPGVPFWCGCGWAEWGVIPPAGPLRFITALLQRPAPADGRTGLFLHSAEPISSNFKLRVLGSAGFCLEQLWEHSPSRSCLLQVMRTLVPCHCALPPPWAPWPRAACAGRYSLSISSCWIHYPYPAAIAAGRAMTATHQAEPMVVSPRKHTKQQRCRQTEPFKNHWDI